LEYFRPLASTPSTFIERVGQINVLAMAEQDRGFKDGSDLALGEELFQPQKIDTQDFRLFNKIGGEDTFAASAIYSCHEVGS